MRAFSDAAPCPSARQLLLVLTVSIGLAAASCATTDETGVSAPALDVARDDYDGSMIVRQPLVSAGAGAWADWTVLGFEWRSKFPNVVVLTAGTKGVVRIVDVMFEIDGEPLERIRALSELTDYGDAAAPVRWSTRRFEVSWEEFQKIAAAKSVRMRVVGPNEAAATSFGARHPGALVNARFAPFVAAVRKQRGEETR